MDTKKLTIAILAVVAVGLVALTPVVSAFQGDPNEHGPNYNAELHDQKLEALNAHDYTAWKSLMEESGAKGRVLDMVTEENFETFVKAHDAALAGDYELAKELRSQIGLNGRDGQGMHGHGMHDGTGREGKGQGRMHNHEHSHENFVDADGDGNCDNPGMRMGRERN